MKGFFNEFKKFIARGNVLDLAVAVVMGNAFGKIVTSLVNDIIMPLVGTIIGQNFSELTVTINGSPIAYGQFIQAIIDFLIIAFCIFCFTKLINNINKKAEKMKDEIETKLGKKKEEKEEKKEEPKDSDETKLLKEIRDLLKEQKKSAK